jgi:hypothetical protein
VLATESKYDLSVSEIPEGEPVMLFRAKDRAFPAVLEAYAVICEAIGSPTGHVEHVRAIRTNVIAWQARNRDKVKAPD